MSDTIRLDLNDVGILVGGNDGCLWCPNLEQVEAVQNAIKKLDGEGSKKITNNLVSELDAGDGIEFPFHISSIVVAEHTTGLFDLEIDGVADVSIEISTYDECHAEDEWKRYVKIDITKIHHLIQGK